jgi:ATP-binding cassette, subfamily B (MDR/TAP), member 1
VADLPTNLSRVSRWHTLPTACFFPQEAKRSIFALLDRKSKVDPFEMGGLRPFNVRGRIEFRNVTFRYPSRPEEPVVKNLNLVIEPGQSVALVGPSGSGKSTIVALLERYYDPEVGYQLVFT